MDGSIIAWTDNTFNPWMGCVKVSAGCKHCYAETLTRDRMGLQVWGPGSIRQITSAANWRKPVQWQRQAVSEGRRVRVFCGSLCDVFEEHETADATRPRLWELVRNTPNLDWQILTKRPERIGDHLPDDWGPDGWPNVWLGASIEDMRVAERADHLRRLPAVVRFVSYEPALGPLDDLDLSGIDWVIYGGESGRNYRPHNPAWPRAMRRKCLDAGTAFFYKQSAAIRTEMGTMLDGETIREYPTPRIREDAA